MENLLLSVFACGTQQAVDMTLYKCSIVGALTLMIFFSMTFIFGRLPKEKEYRRYHSARQRFGLALLVLSVNYSVHLFFTPRFCCTHWAILMNIDTYYISAWLFGSSMLELMLRHFNSPRRDLRNVCSWLAFCVVTATLLATTPEGPWRLVVLLGSSLVFMLYTFRIAYRLVVSYRRAVRSLDNYHSDDVEAYVRWVTVFTHLAVFYGVGQGVFTFLPDRYLFLWILSSIPFYTYGYLSYINYFLGVKRVNEALDADVSMDADSGEDAAVVDGAVAETTEADVPTVKGGDAVVGDRLEHWIAKGEFTRQGLTIVQLAQDICTNRTYVSAYINNHYHVSFREWINSLRLDYAKRLLTQEPSLTIGDVAQRVGYMSLSSFTRVFTASEGTSPGRWRRENDERE